MAKQRAVLVTGGAGFIGANFIQHMLDKYEHRVINVDLLTYAGNLENLKSVEKAKNYKFYKADISFKKEMEDIFKKENPDWIVNFAAESHVDRSIHDAAAFIQTNVVGTQILLDLAKKHKVEKYLQVSTDEVYGTLGPKGYFTEKTPLAPNSPYSASKAAADMLCRAYFETFKMPVLVTRCSNNYGPYQFPEKLIPLMITNALENKKLPVYGDGKQIRDWLHVQDHCEAIDVVLHKGKAGEIYNIGGNNEWQNIDVVKLLLKELKKPETLIEYVKDRLGHDRRYAIDSSKLQKELGWQPKHSFEKGLPATINWYLDNKAWWQKIRSGEYQKYYDLQYANK